MRLCFTSPQPARRVIRDYLQAGVGLSILSRHGAHGEVRRARSHNGSVPVLAAENLHKTYVTGEASVSALAGVSFAVERGDFVALMGPSGCGKSTLLHVCGAMDRPTSGTLRLN